MPISRPYLRQRAGVVCVQCHMRKIKCDLQQRQSCPCTNCLKTGQPCHKRHGLRKEGRTRPARSAMPPPQDLGLHSPASHDATTSSPQERFLGYLAEESFLSNSCRSEPAGVEATERVDEINTVPVNDTLALPPDKLISAFVDAFFANLFPLVPVVEREDVIGDNRSLLLVQCLCLLGSHFRRPRLPAIPSADAFYTRVKDLLNMNFEKNTLAVLKALCLIACRSAESPTNVSLDSPWHWLGVATRYAFNMGLHREMTYQGRQAAGISRRIWWHLFNQDKLQSLCYGRPPAIRLHEVDVKPPTLEDFSQPHPDNEIFLQRVKLCIVLGKVSDAQYGRQQLPLLEDATNIGEYLKRWIEELPDDLKLYRHDRADRAPYRRAVSELHIMYFTGIILFYRLVENRHLGLTPLRISAVAASCIVCLLMEIYYRGEVALLLPINNWYATVASVPLISAQAKLAEDIDLRREELKKLRLVLREMVTTSPSTVLILSNIDRIERCVLGSSGPVDLLPHRSLGGVNGQTGSSSLDSLPWAQFRPVDPSDLFPFPSDLSPSMHLINSTSVTGESHNYPLGPGGISVADEMADEQGQEEQYFALNFDFSNVQLDEFPLAFTDVEISSFGESLETCPL